MRHVGVGFGGVTLQGEVRGDLLLRSAGGGTAAGPRLSMVLLQARGVAGARRRAGHDFGAIRRKHGARPRHRRPWPPATRSARRTRLAPCSRCRTGDTRLRSGTWRRAPVSSPSTSRTTLVSSARDSRRATLAEAVDKLPGPTCRRRRRTPLPPPVCELPAWRYRLASSCRVAARRQRRGETARASQARENAAPCT